MIEGLLTAWTPILIVWGAILLSRTLQDTGSMEHIHGFLDTITRNRVGQLMIVGWAFSFLIEGASGFGTPAALAAPVLVGLGIKPVKAAIFCLVMNSVPVSFGAVGTPTWFGLGQIGIQRENSLRNACLSGSQDNVASLHQQREIVGHDAQHRVPH